MKPLQAPWKPVGEVLPSPALQQPSKLRTTTDGIEDDGKAPSRRVSRDSISAGIDGLAALPGTRNCRARRSGQPSYYGSCKTPIVVAPGRRSRTSRRSCGCTNQP